MSQIIDWEYYSSHFPMAIKNETEFICVEKQAECEINAIVPPYKLNSISEDALKDCIFKVCNYLYMNNDLLSGKAIASVSNDGYSESYAVKTPTVARQGLKDLIYSCVGRLAGAF